jgi:hypothetical protein
VNRERFVEFYNRLKAKVKGKVLMWVGGIDRPKVTLEDFKYEMMTVPLRCPPTVMNEVIQSDHLGDKTLDSVTPAYR